LEAHWQISEGPFKLPKGSLRSGPTVRWASCGSIVINLSGHERTSPPQVRIALSGAWGFLQSGPLRSIRRNPTYGRTYSRIGCESCRMISSGGRSPAALLLSTIECCYSQAVGNQGRVLILRSRHYRKLGAEYLTVRENVSVRFPFSIAQLLPTIVVRI